MYLTLSVCCKVILNGRLLYAQHYTATASQSSSYTIRLVSTLETIANWSIVLYFSFSMNVFILHS